jgi:phospholipid N-methyltransferase
MLFFAAWVRDPLRVAAVAPSSRSLAAVITAQITPASVPIIELGPGSGAFTRALIDRGVPEDRLTLVEAGAEFASLMTTRFPTARVLRMDASALKGMDLFSQERAGAVVSGLPVLAMPARKVFAILKGVFRNLRDDGALYQFTYGLKCPIQRPILHRLGLRATRVGGTLLNLPPASVYRVERDDRLAEARFRFPARIVEIPRATDELCVPRAPAAVSERTR